MDMILYGGVIAMITLLAAMSPGPDMLITLRNALAKGRAAGIWTAWGVALGIFVHVGYALVGISVLIAQSIWLFTAIKWLGALYLVYMGVQALRSKGWNFNKISEEGQMQGRAKQGRKAFISGFITNALNPKATLFFLALFTQMIDPATPKTIQFYYGCVSAVTAGAWFTFFSIFLTHHSIRKRLAACSIWIDRMTGVGFIALAVKLAFAKAVSVTR